MSALEELRLLGLSMISEAAGPSAEDRKRAMGLAGRGFEVVLASKAFLRSVRKDLALDAEGSKGKFETPNGSTILLSFSGGSWGGTAVRMVPGEMKNGIVRCVAPTPGSWLDVRVYG